MAWVEPSVSLPLLAGYVFGRKLTANRERLRFDWKGEILEGMALPAAKPKPGRRPRAKAKV